MLALDADGTPIRYLAAPLEEHLAVGWEYDLEVVIKAPLDAVARCAPRSLGLL